MTLDSPEFATGQRAAERFRHLADFTLSLTPDDIPDTALETAARLLLDTLGIAIASGPMEAGVIARDVAAKLYGTTHADHAARMMFDGREVSLAGAAFAAATQTDNLDGHDGFNPVKGHIGVAVVPALVTLAQHLPDLSGREALAALVVGYEIAGRAGLSLHATVSDYHTSGAWNALGVAAMAARLRGLDADQLREALGIAEYHGPRSQMMREIANPTMLHDGSGMGAFGGISAAILAENGFTGAPALTVESDEAASFWADLGTDWLVTEQYIKPYPICRWAHAPIDAAWKLCREHDVVPDQIARIRISSFHNAIQLFPAMPETTSQAQYSLPFAVGTMIVHGRIGLDHISGAGLSDPAVADLVAKTEMTTDPRHEARFPSGRWADVTFEMRDGRVLASGDVPARGGSEEPFSEADIVQKFQDFATPVLGEARSEAIRAASLDLPRGGNRFSDLLIHLLDPPKRSIG